MVAAAMCLSSANSPSTLSSLVVWLAASQGAANSSGCSCTYLRPCSVREKVRPPLEVSALTRPSSSSCCSAGYTAPGLVLHEPPLRCSNSCMIWYPLRGFSASNDKIAARTSPRLARARRKRFQGNPLNGENGGNPPPDLPPAPPPAPPELNGPAPAKCLPCPAVQNRDAQPACCRSQVLLKKSRSCSSSIGLPCLTIAYALDGS